MNFQVPQFIEIEDKIFGPLTLKQGIYLAGGAGLSFTVYVFLNSFFLTIIFAAPIMVFSSALAFYKPEGRPFISILESGFWYFTKSKLYVWKREPKKKKAQNKEEPVDIVSQINVPRLSDSKLADLSWSLDIKERLEDDINNN